MIPGSSRCTSAPRDRKSSAPLDETLRPVADMDCLENRCGLKWRILPPEATGIYYGEMPAFAECRSGPVGRITSPKRPGWCVASETEGKLLAKTACETA